MKTKILLCLIALVTLAAPAQYQLKHAPSLQDKLKNHNYAFTEQVVESKAETDEAKPLQKALARAAGATHQVNFVLNYPETQRAYFLFVSQDGAFDNWDLDLGDLNQGSNMVTVPAGTYDIIFTFWELENMGTNFENCHHELNVIREQVTVDQDMQLDVSSAEAKNHIHFQTLTIDGEPVNTGTGRVDENWWQYPDHNGNVDNVAYIKYAFCKDYGTVIHEVGNFSYTFQAGDYHLSNHELQADFYVNDVSDRYAFGSYRMINDLEQNIYTTYHEVQGASGDITIADDPSKYQLYENQFAASNHQDEDLYRKIRIWLKREGDFNYFSYSLSYLQPPVDEEATFKYYVSASADESKVGFRPYLQIFNNTKVIMNTPWGDVSVYLEPVIKSPLITNTNGSVVFANGSDIDLEYVNWFFLEWDNAEQSIIEYPFWPPHPVFTYSIDKKKGMLGNNCPIVITLPKRREQYNLFEYEYQGLYGEKTYDHRNNAQVIVDLNGENIYNGPGYFIEYNEETFNIYSGYLAGFDEDGVVDATITTSPFKVDDMDGSNKAQLHYTAGAEDETPPTMTMMHFRDNNGDVTDRFASAEEGTIEFCAGDFNCFYTPSEDFSYFRHAPEIVEVSYSPYGEDYWNELTVEELSEYYWPIMGWFYRGSLAGVTGEAYQGWFDLRFRLQDAAGNWQEQVVSPAFRIDNLAYSSVANVGSDNAHEVARYSIDGKRVDTNHRGVTIVKMSDGTARKVLK